MQNVITGPMLLEKTEKCDNWAHAACAGFHSAKKESFNSSVYCLLQQNCQHLISYIQICGSRPPMSFYSSRPLNAIMINKLKIET